MWTENQRHKLRRLKIQMEFTDNTVINVDGTDLVMDVEIQPHRLPAFEAELLPVSISPVLAEVVSIKWFRDLTGKLTFSKGV